ARPAPLGQAPLAVAGLGHLVPRRAEGVRDAAADGVFVLDHDDAGGVHACLPIGNLPGGFRTVTMWAASRNPSPEGQRRSSVGWAGPTGVPVGRAHPTEAGPSTEGGEDVNPPYHDSNGGFTSPARSGAALSHGMAVSSPFLHTRPGKERGDGAGLRRPR